MQQKLLDFRQHLGLHAAHLDIYGGVQAVGALSKLKVLRISAVVNHIYFAKEELKPKVL